MTAFGKYYSEANLKSKYQCLYNLESPQLRDETGEAVTDLLRLELFFNAEKNIFKSILKFA